MIALGWLFVCLGGAVWLIKTLFDRLEKKRARLSADTSRK
jgi:hypothetical protein